MPSKLKQSGYTPCACRDCFETAVSDNMAKPDFCHECVSAGCPDYQGVAGMSQECQAPHAYGCGDTESEDQT